MKLFNILVVILIGISIFKYRDAFRCAINTIIYGECVEGQRFVLFGEEEGEIHLADLYEIDPDEKLHKYNAKDTIQYILHTRLNSENIKYGDDEALKSSNFNNTKPVKLIAHGWFGHSKSAVNKIITEALLESEDLNVIIVDWSKGANTFYTSSVKNVVAAGEYVAKLVDWLVTNDTPIKAFHLIGYSLGAHVMGIAGRSVKNGPIPYITALDPANPLWGSSSQRIKSSDADYVEVIHTDSGHLGLKEPLGDTDFYPNKGSGQPGCFLSVGCSHSRSYELFADSIDHNSFVAYECNDYKEMSKGKCSNLSQLKMGGLGPKNGSGIFYLATKKNKPFYMI
ncbi:endothelial lipase-like [Arctopsyche grandis]|uniref:endothelial lipase-like n=1 Tax=Arctopsyche grandis TaxID=121162 RepID=UPI00406D7842